MSVRGAPKLSVIVFSRNAVATIGQTLESACSQQPGGEVELLVLDGGSTDGTVEVIRRYQDKIAFWRSAPDGGPTNAINEGIKRATGDVICLLPGDDWLEPGALQAVSSEFAADPDLDVLSCGTRIVRFDSQGGMREEERFTTTEALEFRLRNVLVHPLTAARFIRRRVYQRVGGHSSEYRFGDYDFLVRTCLSRVKSKVLPRLVYTYRRHPQSSTLGGNPENLMVMLGDGIRLAAHYLRRSDLEADDRRALLGLHGRSSAHYAWRLLRRGDFQPALRTVLGAVCTNRMWPFWVIGWLLQGRRERGSVPSVT